jgi:hypothetical protein
LGFHASALLIELTAKPEPQHAHIALERPDGMGKHARPISLNQPSTCCRSKNHLKIENVRFWQSGPGLGTEHVCFVPVFERLLGYSKRIIHLDP